MPRILFLADVYGMLQRGVSEERILAELQARGCSRGKPDQMIEWARAVMAAQDAARCAGDGHAQPRSTRQPAEAGLPGGAARRSLHVKQKTSRMPQLDPASLLCFETELGALQELAPEEQAWAAWQECEIRAV